MDVAAFLTQLSEDERQFLANAVAAGSHQAGQGAACLTDRDASHQSAAQLLAYLSSAAAELRTARDFVRERLEA